MDATFFNKTEDANWKVAWHQDVTIAVRERKDVGGFHAWTMKEGVVHVQAPAEVMSRMVSIRVHLDESRADNGPLRVIGGSHLKGRLSAAEISALGKDDEVTCCVPEGAALVMRLLLGACFFAMRSGEAEARDSFGVYCGGAAWWVGVEMA